MTVDPVAQPAPTLPVPAADDKKKGNFLSRMLDKLPCIGNIKDPKKKELIKKVITVALICFAFAALGAACGAMLAAVVSPVMIAIGGVSGGLVYLAVWGVREAIKKFGYPANKYKKVKPIITDRWLEDENNEKFKKELKEIKNETWFTSWKQLKGLTDQKVERHLWKEIQRGCRYGEALALVELAQKEGAKDCEELLGGIKPETLYKYQLREIIRQDLASADKREDLKALEKSDTVANLPYSDEIKFSFDLLKDENAFKEKFKECFPDQNKPVGATLRLQNSKKSHVIFLQFSPKFRFYDGYSPQFTGFYEMSTQEEFIKALYGHLKGYTSKWRVGTPRFTEVILRTYRAYHEKRLEEENRPILEKVVEKMKNASWFKTWKEVKNIADAELTEHLWREIQKGVHFGKAHALVELTLQQEKTPSNEVLEGIETETIFEHQLREIIREDLAQNNIFDSFPPESDHLTSRGPLIIPFNLLEDKAKFKTKLKERFDEFVDYAATIHLKIGLQAHTFFLQFGSKFCIHDGYDFPHNGFQKQNTEDELIEALRSHLKKYTEEDRQCHQAVLRAYIFSKKENRIQLYEVYNGMKDEVWFKSWQQLQRLGNDKDVKFQLCQEILRGVNFGQTQALIEKTSADDGAKLFSTLLDELEIEKVFKYQLREIIRLKLVQSGIREQLPKIHDAALIKEAVRLQLPFTLIDNDVAFKEKLELCFPAEDKPFAASIRLNKDLQSHVFFLQFTPTFRLFDGYKSPHSGLQEKANKEQFIEALRLHLKKYPSGEIPGAPAFDKMDIQAYRKLPPDEEKRAPAGANPAAPEVPPPPPRAANPIQVEEILDPSDQKPVPAREVQIEEISDPPEAKSDQADDDVV